MVTQQDIDLVNKFIRTGKNPIALNRTQKQLYREAQEGIYIQSKYDVPTKVEQDLSMSLPSNIRHLSTSEISSSQSFVAGQSKSNPVSNLNKQLQAQSYQDKINDFQSFNLSSSNFNKSLQQQKIIQASQRRTYKGTEIVSKSNGNDFSVVPYFKRNDAKITGYNLAGKPLYKPGNIFLIDPFGEKTKEGGYKETKTPASSLDIYDFEKFEKKQGISPIPEVDYSAAAPKVFYRVGGAFVDVGLGVKALVTGKSLKSIDEGKRAKYRAVAGEMLTFGAFNPAMSTTAAIEKQIAREVEAASVKFIAKPSQVKQGDLIKTDLLFKAEKGGQTKYGVITSNSKVLGGVDNKFLSISNSEGMEISKGLEFPTLKTVLKKPIRTKRFGSNEVSLSQVTDLKNEMKLVEQINKGIMRDGVDKVSLLRLNIPGGLKVKPLIKKVKREKFVGLDIALGKEDKGFFSMGVTASKKGNAKSMGIVLPKMKDITKDIKFISKPVRMKGDLVFDLPGGIRSNRPMKIIPRKDFFSGQDMQVFERSLIKPDIKLRKIIGLKSAESSARAGAKTLFKESSIISPAFEKSLLGIVKVNKRQSYSQAVYPTQRKNVFSSNKFANLEKDLMKLNFNMGSMEKKLTKWGARTGQIESSRSRTNQREIQMPRIKELGRTIQALRLRTPSRQRPITRTPRINIRMPRYIFKVSPIPSFDKQFNFFGKKKKKYKPIKESLIYVPDFTARSLGIRGTEKQALRILKSPSLKSLGIRPNI